MDEDYRVAAVQLLEHRPEFRVTQPHLPVAGRDAETVGFQDAERIFDFRQAAVDIRQWQGREKPEAARMVCADPGPIFIPFPRLLPPAL